MTEFRPSDLRHRLALEEIQREEDEGGGFTETWVEVAELWADLRPAAGGESVESDRLTGRVTHEVSLRYRPGVQPAMRFRKGTRLFHILAVIDVDTHRLPDAIVLPSYVVIAVLLTLACVLGADWGALLRAVIGALALYAFYFVLRVVRPAGMGGGDVKLAGIVGAALAWLGWGSLVVGAFAAFLLGGIFGVLLIALRRAGKKTAIPFGPWMLAGAWVGVVAGQAIAAWYIERLLVP